MKVPFLDLRAQYAAIRDEIAAALDEVFESQQFILGPQVAAFEKEIAAYLGVPYALGVSSGSDALLLALMALDIQPGDEVITTPYTFFATIGAIARLRARPVFVDIDPATYNMNASHVKAVVTDKTRAILPVHLFGQCADMDPILEAAQERGLPVIEDAAQAIGAMYKGRSAGSMGAVGCFSFFPSKNLGGAGDGGLATTNDAGLYEKMKTLRVHGAGARYDHDLVGGNFRLDALQAAVLRVKLKHLPEWQDARIRNARFYDDRFTEAPGIQPPAVAPGNVMTYNQYVVRVPQRDRVLEWLQAADIGCAVYYPVPHHLAGCFRYLGHGPGDMPESEQAAKETLALPIYAELTAEQKDYIADTLIASVAACA